MFTQWRVLLLPSGRLHYTSMDYTAVGVALDGFGYPQTPELWEAIRIMESAARSVMNSAN